MKKLLGSFILATSIVLSPLVSLESKAQNVINVSCSSLRGSGTFRSPQVIGQITRPTIVRNCPRLSSGSGFASRYYAFSLARPASRNSFVGSLFITSVNARSAVHPRLALPNGLTLFTSLRDGGRAFWFGNPNAFGQTGRFLQLTGFPAGVYILGFEKLDSPLRSTLTPNFDIYIVP